MILVLVSVLDMCFGYSRAQCEHWTAPNAIVLYWTAANAVVIHETAADTVVCRIVSVSCAL